MLFTNLILIMLCGASICLAKPKICPVIPNTHKVTATFTGDTSDPCVFYQCVKHSAQAIDSPLSCSSDTNQHLKTLITKYHLPDPCQECKSNLEPIGSKINYQSKKPNPTGIKSQGSAKYGSSYGSSSSLGLHNSYMHTIKVFKNANVQGGHLRDRIHSVKACIQECQHFPHCFAVDFKFGYHKQSCYLHFSNTGCLPPKPKMGCTHYKIKYCDHKTSTTSTTTTSTTTTTTTPPPHVFLTQSHYSRQPYQPHQQYSAMSSYQQNTGNSHYGQQHRVSPYQLQQPAIHPPYQQQSVHSPSGSYSSPVIQTFSDSHVGGGQLRKDVKTVSDCIKECQQFPHCQAVDFNFANFHGNCYLHFSTGCSTPIPKTGINHYKLKHCGIIYKTTTATSTTTTTPLMTTPKPLTGVNIAGGVLQVGVVTLSQCLERCSNAVQMSCTGIDFNTNGNQCYLHSRLTECNPLLPLSTSNHYRLIDCKPSTCTYMVLPISNIIGGKLLTTGGTAAECKVACCARNDCAGFDYHLVQKACWLHDPHSCTKPLTTKVSCLHYTRVGVCPRIPSAGK